MTDPHYFKTVRISPIALVKMVMHARSGGSLEVMGIMQGYLDGTALVVTDAFRLPVEGTETRVNAQAEADEYLISYLENCRAESRQENVVGWYHSHPGYGCWLSGIDVETQKLQQKQGPMVAVVIDPDRTVSANKVEIGAFRTYPDDYQPPTTSSSFSGTNGGSGSGSVPLAKVEDFGAHASKYYALEVEHYRSALDGKLLELLWNKYWVQTLAQNPLLSNRDYAASRMCDVAQRVLDAAAGVSRSGGKAGSSSAAAVAMLEVGGSGLGSGSGSGSSGLRSGGDGGQRGGGGGGGAAAAGIGSTLKASAGDQVIEKLVQDVGQIAAKERAGLMAAEVKAQIFSSGAGSS
jgi:COP9 signalosome complex subunit 5